VVLAWLSPDDQMDVSFASAGVSEYVFTLASVAWSAPSAIGTAG
jgi:hypothetical protein